MKLLSWVFLSCVLLSWVVFCVEAGRVLCFRRLKRLGKCGGILKKLSYSSPEECCRGRGVGFATKKRKVGRNRFVCTPCSELLSESGGAGLPMPPTAPKRKGRRRGKKRSNKFARGGGGGLASADSVANVPRTTSSRLLPVSDVTQPSPTTARTTTTADAVQARGGWPRPQTERPNKFGYYAFKRYDDDEEEKVQWSEWSPCSASCGAGWRSRFKICDDCDKNDYENVLSRPCMVNFYCPVDGNWGPWFPWQSCSQSCNGGTRIRHRKCNYPPPAYGGQTCAGDGTNSQDCNEQPCPVDGGWSAWSEFTLCSATCGPGYKRRVRSCDNPTPANGGRDCPGSVVLSRKCELTKCPQDGQWSLWSDWTQCTATCGQGVRTRSRTCDSPRPMYGGKDCEGEKTQSATCSSPRPCPIDGGWSTWNNFGFCQGARCEVGFRIRTRLCSNPRPQYGGAHCKGNQYERVECFNEQNCPRNGSWCPWSKWSPCSTTCAEESSLQARQRTCTCPEPRFNGNDCEGDSVEVKVCSDVPMCKTTEKNGRKKDRRRLSRKCGDGELEGSGADEDCDQEDE